MIKGSRDAILKGSEIGSKFSKLILLSNFFSVIFLFHFSIFVFLRFVKRGCGYGKTRCGWDFLSVRNGKL